jgi:hypothetical protein
MKVPNLKIENGPEKWTWNPTIFAEFEKIVVEAAPCRFPNVQPIDRNGCRGTDWNCER